MGTADSKGTKVFALTGKIKKGGLVEIPPLHNPWFVPFQLFFHFSALLFFIFF